MAEIREQNVLINVPDPRVYPYYCKTCARRAYQVIRCSREQCLAMGCTACMPKHDHVTVHDLYPEPTKDAEPQGNP